MSKQRLVLAGIIGLHYFVFISFVITVLFSFLVVPWFIATSISALIVRVIFSRDECPLTTFENKYRTEYKLINSTGFLKDYILNPLKTFKYILENLK